jgi:hypothetical protein
MFSPMATRAERDEVGEHVGAGHRVVDREPFARAAATAAVAVAQPRSLSEPLPRRAVELGPRGT